MRALPLTKAPLATPLTLAEVPQEHARHLSRLGLRPGTAFSVLRHSTGGGRILSVAGARVALGAALIRAVSAEVVQ